MTKPKAAKITKSAATIAGQLREAIDYTHTPTSGSVERFRLPANVLEENIANRIRNYWRERGYQINIEVHDIPVINKSGSPHSTYRAARSNMRYGLPSGYKELSLGIDPGNKPKPKSNKGATQYD